MLPRHDEPIVAIATAPGRGAIGIVRASGRDLRPLIAGLCGRALAPRHASLLPLRDGRGAVLDQALAIHFPAPASYTGEDVLELQVHGGPVVLQLLLARCLELQPGLRLARPGEFTERAFLNDKLDLAQAEAVGDLIDARTEAAARSASRSLAGVFSREVQALAEGLLKLRMLVEATLDFPEEEIDFLQQADARGQLERLAAALQRLQARARQGALLREGVRVVLAGQPNVGKSSLLNALAGAELAIVTPIPGTTRDRVSETIQIDGVPLHVTDTAGLRHADDAADEVERIGIDRSWEAIAGADVVLVLHDLVRVGQPAYDVADAAIEAELRVRGAEPSRLLHVANKQDAAPAASVPADWLGVSARTGAGLDVLRQALLARAGWQAEQSGTEDVFIARARHVDALRRAAEPLDRARGELTRPDAALEILAEDLRLAHAALGEITGQVSADDLLGEIFGRFCIGK